MSKYENDNYNMNYLETKGIVLDNDSLTLMQSIFIHKKIKNEMYFLKQDEKSKEMAMVTKGLFALIILMIREMISQSISIPRAPCFSLMWLI